MFSFIKAVEMRSVIALVSVLGAVSLAVAEPKNANSALNILSVAVGGYMGALVPSKSKAE